MKKASFALAALLAAALLLVGCSAAFTITSAGNKITIEANNVEDGATAETNPYSVGKGKAAYVDSSLESGRLKIDFAEATVFRDSESADEVIVGDVVASVTVGPGEHSELPLERGDYVLQITAVGSTGGKVTVNIK